MCLAPDLTDACERLARCVQPLADAEGREWLVVRPYREGSVEGYVPVLPWAVPLAEATALELRHAAGKVVPGFGAGEAVEPVPPTIAEHRAAFGLGGPGPAPVNMHTTPAEPPSPTGGVHRAGPSIRRVTPAPQTPDPGRPRSRGVEPQTGRGT
jgi:hypothetical protein